MPELSVIIPTYNAQAFLERCILSIVGQNIEDMEIIVVDDGSSDKSCEICEKLMQYDNRIKLIKKENGGAGSARNSGIEYATGKYIGFVDSDDWLEPLFYRNLLDTAKENNADIVFGGLRYSDENGKSYFSETVFAKEGVYNESEIFEALLYPLIGFGPAEPFKRGCTGSVCICLYKRELLSDIRFFDDKKLNFAEDLVFQLYAVAKSKKCVKTNNFGYNYFVPSDYQSRSHGVISELWEKRLSLISAMDEFAQSLNKNKEDTVLYIHSKMICEALRSMFNAKGSYESIKKYVNSIMNAERVRKASRMIYGYQKGIKNKALMFIFYHKLSFVIYLYIFIKKIFIGGGK